MDRLESWYRPGIIRRTRRFVRWAVGIALVSMLLPTVLIAGYYVFAVLDAERNLDQVATEHELIESFYLVVHTADQADPAFKYPARKWGKAVPVFYHPSLPAWHLSHVARQLRVLSRLTGIEFRRAAAFVPNSGISVFYTEEDLTPDQMIEALGITPDLTQRFRQATCFATYRAGPDRWIQWGFVVYARPVEERRTVACIVEEIAQVLGLQADRASYSPSVFTNEIARPTQLSINDKILVRALYDPAIKPGMTIDDTRRLVPDIIRRLVAGVEARGIEALYQR